MGLNSKEQRDYLIVGQGLAGSLMALNLLQRGKTVLVIDDGHKHAASKVAAGLINPITGLRHALSWRFPEFWMFLPGDYAKWERELGGRFFYQKPLVRFFKTPEEAELFEQKRQSGSYDGIDISFVDQAEGIPGCSRHESGYRVKQSGYLDQAVFIDRVGRHLETVDSLQTGSWSAADFVREPGKVQWKQVQASRIIFTQGFQNDSNPFFRDLPFRHNKGEILELSGPEFADLPILNRGKWLLATSPGCYRAGATYDLKTINQIVTESGIAEITDGVRELIDWKFAVTGSRAGVRPALQDFKPVLGKHPWFPELVIFNGLGSKGSLQAPLLAKELADHLEEGTPLHPEADVERFRKYL